jgi:hypothetical protein
VIFGLATATPELPARWTPLDAVAVVKCLDEDGDLAFCVRATGTLSTWECYALLALAADVQRQEVVDSFESDDVDDGDAGS